MNISLLNSTTIFSSSNTQKVKYKNDCSNKQSLKYVVLGAAGGLSGYLIPVKQVDGQDIISHINGSKKMVMMKTKVPNNKAKLINAGLGVVIGLLCAKLCNQIRGFQ